jgi:hypothetical protein
MFELKSMSSWVVDACRQCARKVAFSPPHRTSYNIEASALAVINNASEFYCFV